jgi:hypothetical protein
MGSGGLRPIFGGGGGPAIQEATAAEIGAGLLEGKFIGPLGFKTWWDSNIASAAEIGNAAGAGKYIGTGGLNSWWNDKYTAMHPVRSLNGVNPDGSGNSTVGSIPLYLDNVSGQVGADTKDKATLNAQYPTAKIGQLILGDTKVYEKISTSGGGEWTVSTIAKVL